MGKINITFHPDNEGFDIELLNGVVSVPAQPGGYIVSTGMGAGKTTSIKELIRAKYNEGILYCVDSKAEATKMYDWVLFNLGVKEGLIKPEEIELLHGDKPDIVMHYRSHPEDLLGKKILITTHARFFRDLIDYFLVFKPYGVSQPLPTFDCDFSKLMSRSDLRRIIIFDETPSMLYPFCEFPFELLSSFSEPDDNGGFKLKSLADCETTYRRFIKGKRLDFAGAKRTNAEKIRGDVVIASLPRFYERWMADSPDVCSIQFTPKDLIQHGMTSRVLIYEGAGDVLLDGSSRFELLDIAEKYNTPITYQHFHIPFKRRSDFVETDVFEKFMGDMADRLKNITGRTLLVVWKDTGKNSGNQERDVIDDGVSDFAALVESKLLKRGLDSDRFKVIYYGSSQSKSTNEFRDYENIVLCGDWNPGNGQIYRKAFCCNTNAKDVKLWYFSQLVARIGIRKHNGKSYRVFYSDDINPKFITELRMYFDNQRVHSIKVSGSELERRLRELGGRETVRDDIRRIANYIPIVRNAIEAGEDADVSVTLKELNTAVDKPGRKAREYQPALKGFRQLGVSLNIRNKTA